MQTNGYKLREELRQCELKLKALTGQFTSSLVKWPGEKKPTPTALSEQIDALEDRVVKLGVLQTQYNMHVDVTLGGKRITLLQAIKAVGSAGRREKRWRAVAAPDKDRHSYYNGNERDPGKIYQEEQVSPEQALKFATEAAQFASELRAAIQIANATTISLDADPKLFEH